jgi:hypothetical protein
VSLEQISGDSTINGPFDRLRVASRGRFARTGNGEADEGVDGEGVEGDVAAICFLGEPLGYGRDVLQAPIGSEAVHLGGATVALAIGCRGDADAGKHALEDCAGARRRGDGAALELESQGAGKVDLCGQAGAGYGDAEGAVIPACGAMGAGGAVGRLDPARRRKGTWGLEGGRVTHGTLTVTVPPERGKIAPGGKSPAKPVNAMGSPRVPEPVHCWE